MSFQERALFVGRLAEPHLVARTVDVLLLEGFRRHPDELGGPLEISFGQIDKSLLVTAIDAAALASKLEGIQVLIVPQYQGFGLTLAGL